MNFGAALDAIKAGMRIARAGWNGKGMFVYLVPPASYPVQTGAAKAHFGEGAMVPYNAYMAIKNVDNTVSTWVPSVNDCLATDWGTVGESSMSAQPASAAAITLPVVAPGPDSLEREIQAKASKAPRVTPADIEAEIASTFYFTANHGVHGEYLSRPGDFAGVPVPTALHLLTFCVLVLKNGFTVTGESACASPENFDAEIGRRIARENAVNKVWPLLGFRLRDQIAASS